MAVAGIDLGGTKLASAIFSDEGKILFKEIRLLDKRTGFEVGDLIKDQLKNLIAKADELNDKITSVGVSVPGIAYSKNGNVWAPNIPGWDNFPLLDEIKKAVDPGIAIKIDSDRACSILGEVWQGSAEGNKDAIFLAVGTGIGAGILINGEVLRGSNDIAGAIGWLALDRPYLSKYIPCGCFEYHASGDGIARVAKELLAEDKNYNGELSNKDIQSVTSHDVFKAFENNDELAKKVFDIAIEFWGMTAANLVSLFNPEKIIFGGGVFGPAVRFLDKIKEEAKKWAQPISITQVEISASALGSDAVLYGAGYLALKIKNNSR